MYKVIAILFFLLSLNIFAQTNVEMLSHYNPYPSRIQNDVLYWLVFQMNYETPTNLVQYKGHGNNSVFLVASGPALEKHRAEAYQEGTRRHQEGHHTSPGGTGPFGTQGLSELESLYAA